jgi:hypothetical protein
MTVTLFVPDIPEFSPLVRAAETVGDCRVRPARGGYWRIDADREMRFSCKDLGLTPAIWNSALSGGFCGRIVEYGRDVMRIVSEE